MTFLTRRL